MTPNVKGVIILGRPKKDLSVLQNKKQKPKAEIKKFICTECNKEKRSDEFYKSFKSASGVMPYCKACVVEKCLDDSKTAIDMNNFKRTLQQLDRPYVHHLFVANANKFDEPRQVIGMYWKDIAMPQYRKHTYDDSMFGEDTDEKIKNEKSVAHSSVYELTGEQRYEFTEKYGFGYTDEELIAIDRKYNLLRANYPEYTALHTEALISYCRFRVKEEFATARGDLNEASKWGDMAQKQAQNARINPSQLSKNDLTSGLSGFGELTRAVEQAVDVIPILPRFLQKPQDKIDFTLWCYINYIRQMQNLPNCEYADIYQFLEERKKDYNQKHDADVDGDEF